MLHSHPAHSLQAALKSARVVVERLIERQKQEAGGKYPETIALVLWGTDNIKTYGESLAQVRGELGKKLGGKYLMSECGCLPCVPVYPLIMC